MNIGVRSIPERSGLAQTREWATIYYTDHHVAMERSLFEVFAAGGAYELLQRSRRWREQTDARSVSVLYRYYLHAWFTLLQSCIFIFGEFAETALF